MPRRVEFRPDSAHGDHPDLADRKTLSTRMIAAFVRAGLEQHDPLDAGGHELHLQAAAHADSEIRENDELTLSGFLEELAASLQTRSSSGLARRAFDKFIAEAHKINCEACVKQSGGDKPCQNADHDLRNLSGRAQCWSLLTELFVDLVKLAEDAYAPLLSQLEIRELHIRLQTRRTNSEQLGARTLFPPETALARCAIVELELPDQFNEVHLTRLPYVLFHEICVHGPEAWIGGDRAMPGDRRTTELCALREGFVDAAAAWLLGDHLVNQPHRLRRHAVLAAKYHIATGQAHAERASPGPSEFGHKSRRSILNQRAQGQWLFNSLKSLRVSDLDLSESRLARLAFALNLMPLTEDERVRLIQSMKAAAVPDAVRRRHKWLADLLAATQACDLAKLKSDIDPQISPQPDFGY